MPLKQTELGGECHLGYFTINIPGSYTADPVEACSTCNFADKTIEKFDLEKICLSPSGLTRGKNKELLRAYASTSTTLSRDGFLEFVKKNYRE